MSSKQHRVILIQSFHLEGYFVYFFDISCKKSLLNPSNIRLISMWLVWDILDSGLLSQVSHWKWSFCMIMHKTIKVYYIFSIRTIRMWVFLNIFVCQIIFYYNFDWRFHENALPIYSCLKRLYLATLFKNSKFWCSTTPFGNLNFKISHDESSIVFSEHSKINETMLLYI